MVIPVAVVAFNYCSHGFLFDKISVGAEKVSNIKGFAALR